MGENTVVLEKNLLCVDMKQRFYDELAKIRTKTAKNSISLTETAYQNLIDDVEKAKATGKKKPRDYWLLNRYDVTIVENQNTLIYPVKEGDSTTLYYISDSDLFQVLHETHLAVGHGGRDRMIKELSTKYKNITRRDIELYLHLCEPCQKKQRGLKKAIVVKPTVFSDFNSRCQVDFIDFQFQPDREYKFILVYQDYLTKFVVLKSLTSKKSEEVAYNLMDIFLLFGAPSILEFDSDREFANNVVTRLKKFWPELEMVQRKSCHSLSQGSVEKASQDIEKMLCTWMQDQKCDSWSEGLRFVQFMKNRAYHYGIKRTPYEALFGCTPKVGFTMSFLPDVLKYINTEEQTEKVIESIEIMENSESNLIVIKEEPVFENWNEALVDSGLNQHDEEMPDANSVCLRENNDTLECKNCCQKIQNFGGRSNKNNETVLCTLCIKTENKDTLEPVWKENFS